MNNQRQEMNKTAEILDQIYEFIWFKDQIFNGVLNIMIPETIIFKNDMIDRWYFMSIKNEIRKRTKSKLNIDELISFFQKKKDYDIQASYRYIDEQQVMTLFLTKDEIKSFLLKKKPGNGNGVLQYFVKSQGLYNTVLKIEWTEYVILFEKLQSLRMLDDTKSNVYERCVTHEQSGFSVNVSTLNGSLLTNMLQQRTTEMIQHIRNVTNGQIKIKRLVAYFKINQKNQLVYLYTNELELQDRQNFSQIQYSVPEQVDLKKQSIKSPKDIVKKYICSSCIQNFTKSGVITMNFSQIYHYLLFQQEDDENFKKIKSQKIPQIIQNICPWLKDSDYAQVKDNSEFQKKEFLICHKCYFQIQDAKDPQVLIDNLVIKIQDQQRIQSGLSSFQKIRIRTSYMKQQDKSDLRSYRNESTQIPCSVSYIKGPLQKQFKPVLDSTNKTQMEFIKVDKQELLNTKNISFFENFKQPMRTTSLWQRKSKSISLYSRQTQK